MSRAWQSLSPTVQATLLMLAAMAFFTSMSVFIRLSAQEVDSFVVVFFVTSSPSCCWRLGSRGSGGMDYGFDAGVWSLLSVQCRWHGGRVHCDHFDTTRAGDRTWIHRPALDNTGAVLILGEVIRARRIAALVVGFIGVLVVLRPGFETLSTGALLALSNAFLLAITTPIVKRLTETERPEAIVAWMVILQSPLSLIPAAFVWTWASPLIWVWLFCLAGAGTIGHVCWTRAVQLAEVASFSHLSSPNSPW